jgi:peptidyl-prolyl cis-trans isomerase-like protein 2
MHVHMETVPDRMHAGEFHCPVMNKVFTEHTHIVAIKTTGNVFCWEAVEELNVKAKNWKELLTDEPFTRKDIIQIQDPLNLQQRCAQLTTPHPTSSSTSSR